MVDDGVIERVPVKLAPDKSRAHISAQSNGVDHLLLSVRDRGSEGLVLLLNLPVAADMIFLDEERELVEYRFSVHPSNRSSGCCITQTIRYKPDIRYTNRVFVETEDDVLCFPVYSERCRAPYEGSKIVRLKRNDVNVSLGSYDPSENTLVYWAVALHKTERVDSIEDFNGRILQFSKFDLLLVWTFLAAPALPRGEIRGRGSNSPRLNDMPVATDIIPYFAERSMHPRAMSPGQDPISNLALTIKMDRAFHSGGYVADVSRVIPNLPEHAKQRAAEMSRRFGSQPLKRPHIFATSSPGSSPWTS